MSEKTVTVTDHRTDDTRKYPVNQYYYTLVNMVGEVKAKKIMMEASVYKKKSFECPLTKSIYTISFAD